jgi:D-glycerate 3-kinase
MPDGVPAWQAKFLERHGLPLAYLGSAQEWFAPMVRSLFAHRNGAKKPLLVAVNGCQGSGKTTLTDYLCEVMKNSMGLRVVALSIDDFYLTRAQRAALATDVHPLLATRGVPGTHDFELLHRTLDGLLSGSGLSVVVPRFDKASDDRAPQSQWSRVTGAVDIVLLEGWCMGALPQSAAQLQLPCNSLEADEDRDGIWRGYVNSVLAGDFLPLYRRVNQWLMLRAPSFDSVYGWRLEQERKLAGASSGQGVMDPHQVARFIQHYQRITQFTLDTLSSRVNYLYQLDSGRQIRAYRHRHTPQGMP